MNCEGAMLGGSCVASGRFDDTCSQSIVKSLSSSESESGSKFSTLSEGTRESGNSKDAQLKTRERANKA